MEDSPETEDEWRVRLGRLIAELRELRRVTQEDLAAAVGRSTAALSRWENGKATPTLWDAKRMAERLDAPAALFFKAPEIPEKISPVAGLLEAAVAEGERTGRAPLARRPAGKKVG